MRSQPAITAGAILEGLAALGFDKHAIAAEAGLADTDFYEIQAELPLTTFVELWNAAARYVPPRATVVAELGLAVPLGAFGVVDYLACSAATIEAGVYALRDHFRAVAFGIALDLIPDARGAWLQVSPTIAGLPQELAHAAEEFTIAVILGRLRCAASGTFSAGAVELTLAEPDSALGFDDLFQAPVSFGHATTRVHLSRACLDTPMRTADPALLRTMRSVVSQLAIAGDGATEIEVAVRSRLRDLLPRGKPTVSSVARSLGLSERSLQRRLAEVGLTYGEVVNRFRATEAERLLTAGQRSALEIAQALGFADQTAFIRAFRSWKGITPGRWVQLRRSGRSE